MANMVIPDAGKIAAVEEVFRSISERESFWVNIFTEPEVPTVLTLLDAYSFPDFTGSGAIAIARSSFEPAVIVGDRAQLLRLPAPSWTMTGGVGETVYGWVLYGADTDTIYAFQIFDTPHTFTLGATLTLDPFKIDCATIED